MKKSKQTTFSILLLLALIVSNIQVASSRVNPDNHPSSAMPLPKPIKANNKVVAHRGGSLEKKCPDNSIESLNYAIELGCYASEIDVYITKDNQVIVAHANRYGKINGYFPWEATYDQIASAGKLANGETIPTLEAYLERVLEAGTILLWIDVKSISKLPVDEGNEYSSRCAERASEIVREMRANHFVEFIVGRADVLDRALVASKGDWHCGYMNSAISPASFHQKGYAWANFSTSSIFYKNGVIKGNYTIEDYVKKGIRVSVYQVDSEEDRKWYISNLDKLYAIT